MLEYRVASGETLNLIIAIMNQRNVKKMKVGEEYRMRTILKMRVNVRDEKIKE